MENKEIKNKIIRAEFFLKKFEDKVNKAKGVPFILRYEEKEALNRVKELKLEYPNSKEVESLFQRTKKCILASKGEGKKIPQEELAYKDSEKMIVEVLGNIANEEWNKLATEFKDDNKYLSSVFPVPDVWNSSLKKIKGKKVVLTNFEYPKRQFPTVSGDYLATGSISEGFYFTRLSTKSWIKAYNALKRFKNLVCSDISGFWSVIGRIETLEMHIPEAGESPTAPPATGWVLDVEVIFIKDKVLAFAGNKDETNGYFAGEARLEELKSNSYTITELPPKSSPVQVIKIFARAIKEKNYDLFLDCLHESWKDTPKALARTKYFWENNQERYKNMYVYVEPIEEEVKITTIQGEAFQEDAEDFFLTDEEKNSIMEFSEPLIERAVVPCRRYKENGRQLNINPVILRREEKQEWRVYGNWPL